MVSKSPVDIVHMNHVFHFLTVTDGLRPKITSNEITLSLFMLFCLNPLTPRIKPLVDTKFSNFIFCGLNFKVSPLIGKLVSSYLLCCCLFFNFPKFVIFGKNVNFGLGFVRSERVS